MFKHLMTATAVLGLSLVGLSVRAESRDQQRAQQHMQAYLGVRADTAAQAAEQEGGVAILEVQSNGPAAEAGLRKGDIITQVGRRTVEDFDDLANAITRHQPGARVAIQARRDGQERTFHVNLSSRTARWMPPADDDVDGQRRFSRLGEREGYGRQSARAEEERDLRQMERRMERLEERLQEQGDFRSDRREAYGASRQAAFLGVRTRSWVPGVSRRRAGDAYYEAGVEVTELQPDSPMDEAGVRLGDVITAVNGRDVATPQEWRQATQRVGTGREIILDVQRGDRQRVVRVHLDGLSARAGDARAFQQLQRRMEQLEDRIQDQGDFSRNRPDRYGRSQDTDADSVRDLQEMRRLLHHLDNRLRDLEQNQQFSRSQGR